MQVEWVIDFTLLRQIYTKVFYKGISDFDYPQGNNVHNIKLRKVKP